MLFFMLYQIVTHITPIRSLQIRGFMARGSFPKGPNYIHPEKPSSVGSRNSYHRENRDEYSEARLVIDEEVDKVLNHINTKLPPEILEKLHISGNIKGILHNYFNQNFQNMLNRYLVTTEDEMSKKFCDMIDREEIRGLNSFIGRDITGLIRQIGDYTQFNTREIDHSVANIYQSLHEHIQRGVGNLEQKTNKLLREKSDIGAFVQGENAYSIIKCHFSDNPLKPESVTDIDLVINISNNDLLEPIFHYQIASETIIRDLISERIMERVDQEIETLDQEVKAKGQDKIEESTKIFEKIQRADKHLNQEQEKESRSKLIADHILDALRNTSLEQQEFDPLSLYENIQKMISDEKLRTKGFNKAVAAITSILDSSRLGYQHIENFKNARKVVIQEYADTNKFSLPDERYTITLAYYDDLQLREMRTAYCQQMEDFDYETQKLFNVFERVYSQEKLEKGFIDYAEVRNNILKDEANADDSENNRPQKVWDEISFIQPEKDSVERMNETFGEQRKYLTRKFRMIRKRIEELYKNENPPERAILDQRLDFLQEEFAQFNRSYNPFHVEAGLLLEVKISTIKRQEITMSGMSDVLNEFLSKVSRGFSDNAMADYSVRSGNRVSA